MTNKQPIKNNFYIKIKSKLHIKALVLSSIILSSLLITSCGLEESSSQDLTKISRTIEYDTEAIYSELVNIIETGDYSQYNNVNLEFEQSDTCNIDDNARYYFCHNSVYIQVDEYMYRFQLDDKYNIASYIKYRIEG